MKILRYKDIQMAEDFVNAIDNNLIIESENSNKEKEGIFKKVISDLKLNAKLITSFGAGIGAMYPIVEGVIKNMNLNIELTPENIVLMSMAAVSIAYTEEEKKNVEDIKEDARSLLEELKLRGIGNNIIKKLVDCVKSVGNIFKFLFNNKIGIVRGYFDLLQYTAFLLPTMNAIQYLVGKYDMNLDTLPGNFLSLGLGITTLFAKNGIDYIVDKINSIFPGKVNKKVTPKDQVKIIK